MKNENLLFAMVNNDGSIDIGLRDSVQPDVKERSQIEELATRRSSAFTAVETFFPVESPFCVYDSPLNEKEKTINKEELINRLTDLIDKRTPLTMMISEFKDPWFILEPENGWMKNYVLKFRILRFKVPYHLSILESAAIGEKVKVALSDCSLPYLTLEYLDSDIVQAKQQEYSNNRFLSLLSSQPEDTFVQVTFEKPKNVTNRDGKTITVREAKLGEHKIGSVLETHISHRLFFPDHSIVMLLGKNPKNNRLLLTSYYVKSDGRLDFIDNPLNLIPHEKDTIVKTGIVTSLFKDRSLLEISFKEDKIRGSIQYRKKNGEQFLSSEFTDRVGLMLRVGYPSNFEISRSVKNPYQVRINVRGISDKLFGRLKSSFDCLTLDKKKVNVEGELMSPAAVVGEDIMMVSPDFTAFMPLNIAPLPLLKMAQARIFSPKFLYRCDLHTERIGTDKWKLFCSPSKVNLKEMVLNKDSEIKIACALEDRLLLMVGNNPAMTPKLHYEALVSLLNNEGIWKWNFSLLTERESWVLAKPLVQENSNNIAQGMLIRLEKNSTYRTRRVLHFPEDEEVQIGEVMLVIGVNEEDGSILATTRPELFNLPRIKKNQNVSIIPMFFRNGSVLFQYMDKFGVYTLKSKTERIIFEKIYRLYGNKTVTRMVSGSSSIPFRSFWTGFLSDFDYSPITGTLTAETARPWSQLSTNTPYLFGDVPMKVDEIEGLSDFLKGMEGFDGQSETSNLRDTAEVISVNSEEESVSFLYRDKELTLIGRKALRLPLATSPRRRRVQTPLENIFKLGSKWRLDTTNLDEPRLFIHSNRSAILYFPVSPLNNLEWVLKDESGAIGVSDTLLSSERKDGVFMSTEEVEESVAYLREADSEILGLTLRLEIMEIAQFVIICRDTGNFVNRRIELPLNRVSLNPEWSPVLLSPGVILHAKVIEVLPEKIIVDRRPLLFSD